MRVVTSDMKRRTVLAAAAASATASVGGCLADGGSDEDGDGDDGDGADSDGGDGGGDGDGSGVDGSGITDRSIETTERTCGSQDVSRASMTVADGAIVVEGTLSASTPCHDAVLSSALLEDRTLRIGVDVSQQDGVCQQCIGEISYEATVELDDPRDLDSVQVSHAGGGQHQFDVE